MSELYTICRTSAKDEVFIALVDLLNAELAEADGKDHAFYHQYNGLDSIEHVVVMKDGEEAIACGAIKKYDEGRMEVKRMYTSQSYRLQGCATNILQALEAWAKELGYAACILETGKRQPEAIALYQKSGYQIISNYGQYEGVENSVCFEKGL